MHPSDLARRLVPWGASVLLAVSAPLGAASQSGVLRPLINEDQFISSAPTPPTQAQCISIGRRCFSPQAIQNSYNLGPLYARGLNGKGQTIVLVDSFGSATMRSDLNVFNTAFNLPHMCGETGVTCTPGMPTFDTLSVQGSPSATPPPSTANNPGQEAHNLWALEVALDVEWAHSVAPGANILLVTTPTAETLGVQGFPLMMNAEKYVIEHHLGSVISQSFGAAEESFGSSQSLENLRDAFKAAQANNVTVLASSGDNGTANIQKQPVPNPKTIPFPTVGWPASDPLVTAVGGTYLCTDAKTGVGVDSTNPPAACVANPGQREVGWVDSGGGFSHVFGVPSFQTTLPPGSTAITTGRGVPDVGYQASARTGVLVYETDESDGGGWFVVGGTSSGSPQWAGIIAIADQLNGAPLGYINPALYRIGSNPTRYANDFFDVTTGNNQLPGSTVPGYPATTGWDPVTGLGTPNAANFVPDLVAAVNGH